MNGVSILVLVIFFGELSIIDPRSTQGLIHLTGLLLIFLAMYLLYKEKTHEGSEATFNYKEWIKWITPFIFIIGIGQALVKPLVAIYDPLLLLSLQYMGSFSTIAILSMIKKEPPVAEKQYIAGALLSGLFSSCAVALLYTSLTLINGTQALAMTAIGVPIITILIGIFIFKEKFTSRILLPFFLALVAIFLLK